MRYVLIRLSDNMGDSGPMCQIIDRESWTAIPGEHRPRVGCAVRVGSPYARTYSSHDYWTTTPVQEILEESDNRMVFRTNNSIYEWKII
jgi:hypothetical protein